MAVVALGPLSSAIWGDPRGEVLESWRGYIPIAFAVLRIIPAYFLFAWQQRSVELHRYLGGTTRGGVWAFVAVFFGVPKLLAGAPEGLVVFLRL